MVIVTKRGDRISREATCDSCGSELIYFPYDPHMSFFDKERIRDESRYKISDELQELIDLCPYYITCPLCNHEIQVS